MFEEIFDRLFRHHRSTLVGFLALVSALVVATHQYFHTLGEQWSFFGLLGVIASAAFNFFSKDPD